MSMGLEGAFGADAFQQRLRQQVLDELAAEHQKLTDSLAVRGSDRADRALNQQDVLTRLKIQEMADAKQQQEQDNQFRLGTTLNNTIPAGSVLPPDSPGVKPLQMVGALKEQAPTLPSTSYIGAQRVNETASPPEVGAAPSISGRLVSVTQNAGNPRQFVKLPSQAEQVQASTSSERQRMDEARMQSLADNARIAEERANAAGDNAAARGEAERAKLALEQAKLDFAKQLAGNKDEAWTPIPGAQVTRDANGGYSYPLVNKRGETKLVPLPSGMTPEKPATDSEFTNWFRSLVGGGSSSSGPQVWVRGADGKLHPQ